MGPGSITIQLANEWPAGRKRPANVQILWIPDFGIDGNLQRASAQLEAP